MSSGDLCARLMLESDTTLREHLGELERYQAVERRDPVRAHGGEYRLTRGGERLLAIVGLAGAWLSCRPGDALSPESDVAWRAFTALADGWERSLIQHLLLQPSTGADLQTTVPELRKDKIKRMLRRLHGAGLVKPLGRNERMPRWGPTEWTRRAIAVLAAIARWERIHLRGEAEPVAPSDGAIALLAALPLVRPEGEGPSGICAFTVEADAVESAARAMAVWVKAAEGRVTVCSGGPSPPPDAWVRGGVDAWLEAVIGCRLGSLHLGGDLVLAEHLVRGLHEDLFGGFAHRL
ncbi:MAG: hypothetical protein JST08_14410 [Actinobacteria bacterium]|nr:hypothetical protein [Actinomycetota bacterium]